jgi:hypothetical protein
MSWIPVWFDTRSVQSFGLRGPKRLHTTVPRPSHLLDVSVGRRRAGHTGERERQDLDDILPWAASRGHPKGHHMGVTERLQLGFVPGQRAGQGGERELNDPDRLTHGLHHMGHHMGVMGLHHMGHHMGFMGLHHMGHHMGVRERSAPASGRG